MLRLLRVTVHYRMGSITRISNIALRSVRYSAFNYVSSSRSTALLSVVRPVSISRSYSDEKKKTWPFHLAMSDEQKKNKEQKIKEMKAEEQPKTIFAKVKYYFKRYWYIAVPAHMISCTGWFITFYALIHSGVDVIALLQMLHVPEVLVDKIKETPPSAGVFVIALLLYKIATPLRYATTLVLIQGGFWGLRRIGKLPTAREVEYKMRSEYELNKKLHGRKLYRYRNLGVRDIERKNSQGSILRRGSLKSDETKKE